MKGMEKKLRKQSIVLAAPGQGFDHKMDGQPEEWTIVSAILHMQQSG